MQQTTSVAVLATHLAHTDRRALSQAWYSALHLADHAPPPRARPAAARPPSRGSQRSAPYGGATESPERAAGASAVDAGRAGGGRTAGARRACDERVAASRDASGCAPARTMPTVLARITEREAARAPVRAAAASFTVQAADGRVHLLVRSDGTGTRVVAVCTPSLRERVERALAHVRFTLAGAGTRVASASAEAAT